MTGSPPLSDTTDISNYIIATLNADPSSVLKSTGVIGIGLAGSVCLVLELWQRAASPHLAWWDM
jgi:hypothetical protein